MSSNGGVNLGVLLFSVFLTLIIYLMSFNNQINDKLEVMSKLHTHIGKGVAILLVIFSHIGGKVGVRYFTPLGGIGVAIFIIITGFGLNESFRKNNLNNYWKKKIVSVWFPFFLIRLYFFVGQFALFKEKVDLHLFIREMLLFEMNHPYSWYIQFLFIWYLVFYILSKIFINNNKLRIGMIFIFSIGLLFSSNGLWAEQAISFFAGVFFSEIKNSNPKKLNYLFNSNKIIFFLFTLGISFLILKQFNFIRLLPNTIYSIIELFIKFPLALVVLIFINNFYYLFKNNFINYLGTNSYSIYLVHAYTIMVLSPPNYFNVIFFLILTYFVVYIFNKTINFILK